MFLYSYNQGCNNSIRSVSYKTVPNGCDNDQRYQLKFHRCLFILRSACVLDVMKN